MEREMIRKELHGKQTNFVMAKSLQPGDKDINGNEYSLIDDVNGRVKYALKHNPSAVNTWTTQHNVKSDRWVPLLEGREVIDLTTQCAIDFFKDQKKRKKSLFTPFR